MGLTAAATLAAAAMLGACGGAGQAAKAPTSYTQPSVSTTQPTTTTTVATTTTTVPLRVVGVMPADGAKHIAAAAPVTVTYNRAPGSHPQISPATAGSWVQPASDVWQFHPAGYWAPGTVYTVTAATPEAGVTTPATKATFTIAIPSVLALQQYLAMLGYLPLRFTPTGGDPNRLATLRAEPASPNQIPRAPLQGQFAWAYPGVPATLSSLWYPGVAGAMTTGAIMQFEQDNGLAPDGDAGPQVWNALLRAVATRQTDPNPYNYVTVTESLPETLLVWQDGKVVYQTPVNTGAPGSATPQGTWPVIYKQDPNLMKGCEPDGSCYQVWVRYASYFLPSVGDAIHAYPRYSYGYPQSNGCVEVDPSQGATVYGYDPVGTLVTVAG